MHVNLPHPPLSSLPRCLACLPHGFATNYICNRAARREATRTKLSRVVPETCAFYCSPSLSLSLYLPLSVSLWHCLPATYEIVHSICVAAWKFSFYWRRERRLVDNPTRHTAYQNPISNCHRRLLPPLSLSFSLSVYLTPFAFILIKRRWGCLPVVVWLVIAPAIIEDVFSLLWLVLQVLGLALARLLLLLLLLLLLCTPRQTF